MPHTIEISKKAFNKCETLKKVIIPNVTFIGKSAFKDCTGLKEIDISSITDLKSLKPVRENEELKSGVNENAFDKCTAINTIIVNSKYTELDLDRAYLKTKKFTKMLNMI